MATFAQLKSFGPYFSGGNLQAVDVYHYTVGTSTTKDAYLDRSKTSTAAQPIVSDANGVASAYFDGLYKIVIKLSGTSTILYTYDNFNIADNGLTGEGTALPSAATLALGTDGDFFHVTGTANISAISGNIAQVTLVFDASLLLTNSGVLILQDGQNATTQAGDVYVFQNEGLGVWREVSRSALRSSIRSMSGQIENAALSISMASNAITIALKTAALSDPTTNSPVKIAFRNATLTTGDYSVVSVTSALSMTVSAGSTLGFTTSQTSRIYVGAMLFGGAAELFVYHPLSGNSLVGLNESALGSTSAEGGAGAADSAQVLYSTTARSNVPIRILGYFDVQTGATAGNWGNAATQVQLMGSGVRRTGDTIQVVYSATGAVATGTGTYTNLADTVPTTSNGDQYMSLAITPTNTINRLWIESVLYGSSSTNSNSIMALHQDSTANALAAGPVYTNNSTAVATNKIQYDMAAGTTSATTFKIRAGTDASNGGTFTFNGSSGSRRLGGVLQSYIRITEICT